MQIQISVNLLAFTDIRLYLLVASHVVCKCFHWPRVKMYTTFTKALVALNFELIQILNRLKLQGDFTADENLAKELKTER